MNLKATAAEAANEPILHCPNCNHEIKLTESLAAPLLAETRQRFNEQLAAKDAEVARKTETLRKEQDAVTLAREQIEDELAGEVAGHGYFGVRRAAAAPTNEVRRPAPAAPGTSPSA